MLPEMKLPGSREPSKKGEILSARKLKNMVPTWKLTRRIWPIGIIWVSPREKTNLRKSWKKEKGTGDIRRDFNMSEGGNSPTPVLFNPVCVCVCC